MPVAGHIIKTVEVYNQMEMLGKAVGNEDPCNVFATIEILIESIQQLIVDLTTSIKNISNTGSKNAGLVILSVLQEMIGPSFFASMNGILGFVMGNTLGIVMQSLALVMSSLKGV